MDWRQRKGRLCAVLPATINGDAAAPQPPRPRRWMDETTNVARRPAIAPCTAPPARCCLARSDRHSSAITHAHGKPDAMLCFCSQTVKPRRHRAWIHRQEKTRLDRTPADSARMPDHLLGWKQSNIRAKPQLDMVDKLKDPTSTVQSYPPGLKTRHNKLGWGNA